MREVHSFQATLTAFVEISDSEFQIMFQSSENHYDTTVKSSSRIGGFLYGLRNRRSFDAENKICDLSIREISLIMKSLELDRTEEAVLLMQRLARIGVELTEEEAGINNQLQAIAK